MTRPRALLAALLCAALPGTGFGQTVAGARAAGPQAVPPFVAQLGVHLQQAELRLELGPASLSPALPTVALPSAAAGLPSVAAAALEGVPAAVEYLSRAALPRVFLKPIAGDPAPDSARVAAAALADPAVRAAAAVALRSQGSAGEAVAERLEGLGRAVDERRRERPGDFAALDRLGRDLRIGPAGDAAYLALSRHFAGAAPLAAPEVFAPEGLSGPEAFAGYAARRFTAGAAAEKPAAVVYPAPRLSPEGVPADSELYDRVALSPLTNPERERVVVDLFQKAGASPAEIQLQDAGRGRHNIFVVKKGRTDRVVVVGGHHDKVGVGAGTIDNWTGATMVVNLYQAMRDLDTEATYVFIAFAREEEGLLGSAHYVRQLSAQQRDKIDAMLNLDTMGVNATLSWKNKSDRVLLDLVARLAQEKGLDLQEVSFWGGDSDQSSFRRAGILGVMLFGATEEVIWDIIHSARDTIAAFSLPHYKNAYLLSLELIRALDKGPARKGFSAWWASLRAWLMGFVPA